jgi:hypothetical protein
VTANEPPVSQIANTISVFPSFASLIISWNDPMRKKIYIYLDLTYMDGSVQRSHQTIYTSTMTERLTVPNLSLYGSEPVDVKVQIEDEYGNRLTALETTVTLLSDSKIDKSTWTLLPVGTVMGGVTQTNGSDYNGQMFEVIDGITEETELNNFYYTNQAVPWNIIIDLGARYELSRVLTHQRFTYPIDDLAVRGSYYRGDNVLRYNIYVWDDVNGAWEFCTRNDIAEPVVEQETDYVRLGNAGDETYLYPQAPAFSRPTQYFRLEALNGKNISEITLFGRPAF